MYKAIIKVGYGCNNKCVFCHAGPKKIFGELNYKQIKKKIDLLRNKKVDCILFSGGEPTIKKNILKIQEYANEQGFSTGLITNARTLSLPSFLEKLTKFDLKFIYTSLHSSKEEIHNKITKSESFNQTIKAIKNLIEKDINLLVNIVIINDNLESINSTINLLKKLKVKKIKLSFVEPLTKKDMGHTPDITTAAEIIRKILKEDKDDQVGWDGFPLCLMKGFEDKAMNLKTNNIRYISEVWENKFYPVDNGNKIKPDPCNACKRNKACGGIYKTYFDNRNITLDKY